MKTYALTIILALCLACTTASGQATDGPDDSTSFESIFTQQLYADPNSGGNWFIHPPIQTQEDFEAALDRFVFTESDLLAGDKSIELLSPIYKEPLCNTSFNETSIFDETDPAVQLDFTINSKTGSSYALKNSAISPGTETAFLIIPGTGDNETSNIQKGIGYHTVGCHISNMLSAHGDVYTYCKPNEDFRALYHNKLKLNALINDKLLERETPYAVNYMVECIAMVKALRLKYKRVIVVGLSQGAHAALIVSMKSQPDAAIVSGGYSVLFDNYYPSEISSNLVFDNLLVNFSKDSVKYSIATGRTEYLFTYGFDDYNWIYWEEEAILQSTSNYFSGIPHYNVFTDYYWHVFPCQAIDSFVTRINNMPVATIMAPDLYNNDSIVYQVQLKGIPPFAFDLYQDGMLLRQFSGITSEHFSFSVYAFGTYNIRHIRDGSSYAGADPPALVYDLDPSYVPVLNQPSLLEILTGSETILSTKNMAGVSYQWYKNGIILPGAISSYYKTSSPGHYKVKLIRKTFNKSTYESQVVLQTPSLKYPVITTIPYGDSVLLTVTKQLQGVSYQWYRDGVAISGASHPVYYARQEGQYRVMVSATPASHLTGQIKISMSGSYIPRLNFTYSKVILKGTTLRISVLEFNNVSYQWYRNGEKLTADTFSSLNAGEGVYYVSATSVGEHFSDTIIISEYAPLVSNGPSLSLLTFNRPVFLSVEPLANATYQWLINSEPSEADTFMEIRLNEPGIYSVLVKSGSSVFESDPVSVVQYIPEINGDVNLIGEDSIAVQVSHHPEVTYTWFKDGEIIQNSGTAIYAKNEGSYLVRAYLDGDSAESNILQISRYNPVLNYGELVLNNSTPSLELNIPPVNGVTYIWYRNQEAIPGETSSSITISDSGAYAVKAVSLRGTYAFSNTVVVKSDLKSGLSYSGGNTLGGILLKRFEHGLLEIAANNTEQGYMVIELMDMQGRIIHHDRVYKNDNSIQYQAENHHIAPGIYTLIVKLNASVHIQKLTNR